MSAFLKSLLTNKNILKFYILCMFFFHFFLIFNYEQNSVHFLPRLYFIALHYAFLDAVFFIFTYIFYRRKNIWVPLAIATTLTNISIGTGLYGIEIVSEVFHHFGDWLVKDIWNIKFLNISMTGSSFSWMLAASIYAGIGLIIYGRYFIKSKENFDTKIEKQIIFQGLGLYAIIIPFAFIFTHFTFVGSSFQYLQGLLQYNHKAIAIYEQQHQHDSFKFRNTKWFPDLKSAITYYSADEFKKNTNLYNLNDKEFNEKLEFYVKVMNTLHNLEENGFKDSEDVTYDTMKTIPEWFQVAYDFKFSGSSEQHKTLWMSDVLVTNVAAFSAESVEDVTRHAIFYIKQAEDGSYYVLFDYNRIFKDEHYNYIFNNIFVLFNLTYISLFLYLIHIHRKERLSNRKSVKKAEEL